MIQDSTILLLQFGASLFMATDYFLERSQQESVNAAIRSVVKPLQDNVDEDIKDRLDLVAKQWVGIVIALAFVLAAWIGVHALPHLSYAIGLGPVAIAVASLFFIFLLAGGMPKITSAIVVVVVPLALASSMRAVTYFLIRCPKGTVFGLGFLLLMAAFLCRYLNLQ